MRREHDVRRLANRVVGGERLALVDVERGAAEVAAVERRHERLVVDDAAARQVGDDAARGHERDLAAADQPLRLVVERRVDRDDVRLLEKRIECRGPAESQCSEAIVGDVRIEPDGLHAERLRAQRDLTADAADADDA